MLHGSLWKKVLIFAIPIALSNFLQQLFNSADMAVVGQFAGSDALAAVGANGAIINLIINLFVGLSIGANVVLSNYKGMGDKENVSRAAHTSVMVAFISGVFLTVVGLLIAPWALHVVRAPENIIEDAILYMRIYFIGMPFVMMYNFESAIYRSMGDTRTPLIVLFIAGVLNIGLNLLFVLGFKMTVDGVAWATVISNAVSTAILMVLLVRRKDEFRITWKGLKVHGYILWKMVRVGVPSGLQGAIFSISNVLVQSSMNTLGSTAVAASTTSGYLDGYVYSFVNAFGHTATTFVATNYGAGEFERCRKSTRASLVWGVAIGLAIGIAVFFFARPCAMIFTTDPAVLDLAYIRIRNVIIFMWMNTIDDVMSGTMKAYGWNMVPTFIMVFGICGVRILWIFTLFRASRSFVMLTWLYPVSWLVTNIAITIAYFVVLKKMKKQGKFTPVKEKLA